MRTVSIPSSVTSIGDWAFYRCPKLTAVQVSRAVKYVSQGDYPSFDSKCRVTLY